MTSMRNLRALLPRRRSPKAEGIFSVQLRLTHKVGILEEWMSLYLHRYVSMYLQCK